jgi:hypothetical protein
MWMEGLPQPETTNSRRHAPEICGGCEPDPLTRNLDPAELAARMTKRTVAVLITHMNGLPTDVSQ